MNTSGATLSGGPLVGSHIPLPTRTVAHQPASARPRGLDWAAHTAPVDHAAIAQARALAVVEVERVKRRTRRSRRVANPTPKMPPTFDVDAAIATYQAGSSLAEAGAVHGISGRTLRAHMVARDVPRRPRGWEKVSLADIRAERDQGIPVAEIAARHGVKPCTLYRRMQSAGMGTDGGLRALKDRLGDAGKTAADLRVWAAETGRRVPTHGVPSRSLVDAYLAASSVAAQGVSAVRN